MSSKIEDVLLKATKQKPQKKGEERQAYLLRLAVTTTQKLSDSEWDALEAYAGVQEWVNDAIDADNAKKTIKDFPDLEDEPGEDDDEEVVDEVEEDDEEGDEEDDDEEDEDPPAKSKKSEAKKPEPKKTDKKTEKPASKKPEEKKAPVKKGVSLVATLKQLIVKKPKMTVDDLIAAVEKKGFDSPSRLTVSTIRADTRNTLKVLNEAGMLDIEL